MTTIIHEVDDKGNVRGDHHGSYRVIYYYDAKLNAPLPRGFLLKFVSKVVSFLAGSQMGSNDVTEEHAKANAVERKNVVSVNEAPLGQALASSPSVRVILDPTYLATHPRRRDMCQRLIAYVPPSKLKVYETRHQP